MLERNLIYHDMIDTVRTPCLASVSEPSRTRYQVMHSMADAGLMLSVLLQRTPVLSQTQAFDSSLLLSAIADPQDGPALRWVIEQGRICLAMYDAPDVTHAFRSALARGTQAGQSAFLFSAWPELQGDQAATQRDALARYIDTSDAGAARALLPSVIERLDALRSLSEISLRSPCQHRALRSPLLLQDAVRSVARRISSPDVEHLLNQLADSHGNHRAAYHSDLEQMENHRHNPFVVQQVRNIVDMCYNTVIAKSLNADSVWLTGQQQAAVDAIGSAIPNRMSCDLLTARNATGISELDWNDVREHINSVNWTSRDASRVLARVHMEHGKVLAICRKGGGAILDKIGEVIGEGITDVGMRRMGMEFKPVAMVAGSILGHLAAEIWEKAVEITCQPVLEWQYRGLLQRLKV